MGINRQITTDLTVIVKRVILEIILPKMNLVENCDKLLSLLYATNNIYHNRSDRYNIFLQLVEITLKLHAKVPVINEMKIG